MPAAANPMKAMEVPALMSGAAIAPDAQWFATLMPEMPTPAPAVQPVAAPAEDSARLPDRETVEALLPLVELQRAMSLAAPAPAVAPAPADALERLVEPPPVCATLREDDQRAVMSPAVASPTVISPAVVAGSALPHLATAQGVSARVASPLAETPRFTLRPPQLVPGERAPAPQGEPPEAIAVAPTLIPAPMSRAAPQRAAAPVVAATMPARPAGAQTTVPAFGSSPVVADAPFEVGTLAASGQTGPTPSAIVGTDQPVLVPADPAAVPGAASGRQAPPDAAAGPVVHGSVSAEFAPGAGGRRASPSLAAPIPILGAPLPDQPAAAAIRTRGSLRADSTAQASALATAPSPSPTIAVRGSLTPDIPAEATAAPAVPLAAAGIGSAKTLQGEILRETGALAAAPAAAATLPARGSEPVGIPAQAAGLRATQAPAVAIASDGSPSGDIPAPVNLPRTPAVSEAAIPLQEMVPVVRAAGSPVAASAVPIGDGAQRPDRPATVNATPPSAPEGGSSGGNSFTAQPIRQAGAAIALPDAAVIAPGDAGVTGRAAVGMPIDLVQAASEAIKPAAAGPIAATGAEAAAKTLVAPAPAAPVPAAELTKPIVGAAQSVAAPPPVTPVEMVERPAVPPSATEPPPPPPLGIAAAAAPVAAMPAPGPVQTVAQQLSGQVLDIAADGAWIDDLARDIGKLASGTGDLRFRLTPETLGELRIEISQTDRGAIIKMAVSSEAAQAALAEAQPRLLAEARAQGVRIAEAQIDLSSGHQQGRSDAQRQPSTPADGPPLRAARTHHSEAGMAATTDGRRRADRYA